MDEATKAPDLGYSATQNQTWRDFSAGRPFWTTTQGKLRTSQGGQSDGQSSHDMSRRGLRSRPVGGEVATAALKAPCRINRGDKLSGKDVIYMQLTGGDVMSWIDVGIRV